MTRPPLARDAASHWKLRPLSRRTALSLFDSSSSGEKIRKLVGFLGAHQYF
jgi:hypothetical protein